MATPSTPKSPRWTSLEDEVPLIDSTEPFAEVVQKMSSFISLAVDAAYTYEQLRTTVAGQNLRPLIASVIEECHHPGMVAAILGARWLFDSIENDDSGLSESRGLACEFVASQVVAFLSDKDLIDYLLFELPTAAGEKAKPHIDKQSASSVPGGDPDEDDEAGETSALLPRPRAPVGNGLHPPEHDAATTSHEPPEDASGIASLPGSDINVALAGLNTLEIAAVANAKKFLSQRPVQKIVEEIWNGDVVFWQSLSLHAVKQARTYNKRHTDVYTRLRVPKYQKTFQIAFFVSFLLLYYTVLVERNPYHVTVTEVLLYLWITAFAYDEYGEFLDAGLSFYITDFWSLWDIGIIGIGVAFLITRTIGLARKSDYVIDVAFDILSMEALFLVPRICSVMSLNPYFGSLIPILKEMTRAFMKFLPVIVVLYLGFLTTFTMLARDRLTLNEMSWILIKVFFGSSYLGFDVAVTISPLFGYPLMLIFVCLTNILLITALVSLVSNSLTEVMAHAREEYLFQYSIYVLESSTSRRLTYFMPPLNLIPLLFLRPLRLFWPSESVRGMRIVVLKATHLPFVGLIWAYERFQRLVAQRRRALVAATPLHLDRPLAVEPNYFRANISGVSRPALNPIRRMDSLPGRDQPDRALPDTPGDTDLLALVQKLSTQVDALTSMVAGQRKD